MNQATMAQVLSLYSEAGMGDRLHLAIRWRLCPFETLAAHVPADGLIVDVGCGHGTLAALLALQAPRRQVLGLEVAAHKLRVGRQATGHVPNLHLLQGNASAIPVPSCGAIVIVDVAYLLAPSAQQAILDHCYSRLEPGGWLLLKDVDTRPHWKYALCYAEEWLVGRVLAHLTGEQFHTGTFGGLHFRAASAWIASFQRTGFVNVQVKRLDRGYIHPHILVMGQQGGS